MGKGGKYLAKKAPVAKKKKKKILPMILMILLLIVALCIGAGVLYYNYLLGMISRPDDVKIPQATAAPVLQESQPALETEEPTVGTTSPEETWPEIVSDENITNFMLVGNAYRPGEEYYITDTMILVSVNREQKTITLTSLMRDMCLVWPQYVDTLGRTHTGNNRINMAYNMGYSWTKNKQDSMDVLESIVQYNFGIPVERTIEVDFKIAEDVINLLGGVEVDISQEELDYLLDNHYEYFDDIEPGVNRLNGWPALCYARARKVGHGDYDRTDRQREVITSLLNKLKEKNILEIHKLFVEVLPMITTDMTNKEITNYAWEFIPMLKDLKIQSQRIPYDDNEISVVRDGDNMIAPRDLKETARRLQESIGMPVADAE